MFGALPMLVLCPGPFCTMKPAQTPENCQTTDQFSDEDLLGQFLWASVQHSRCQWCARGVMQWPVCQEISSPPVDSRVHMVFDLVQGFYLSLQVVQLCPDLSLRIWHSLHRPSILSHEACARWRQFHPFQPLGCLGPR